jgi:hypothetical protein
MVMLRAAHSTYLKSLNVLYVHNDSDVSVIGSPGLLKYSGNLAAVSPLRTPFQVKKIVHHQGASSLIGP